MRRFLDKLTGNSSPNSADVGEVEAAESNMLKTNDSSNPRKLNENIGKTPSSPRTIGLRARPFRQKFSRSEGKQPQKSVDDERSASLIRASAQELKIVIDEILNDASGLSGDNFSGFTRLIAIIESDNSQTGKTYSSMNNLLNLSTFDGFADICNSYDLGNSLFNALRLLRMYEIRQSRHVNSGHDEVPVTLRATERVLEVFFNLLSSPQTIELLRPSLVKLFVFPLSSLPPNAIHFQDLSSQIITQICKSGLTSQIVWFLHDQQAMHHMARQLSELSAVSDEASVMTRSSSMLQDISLRGLDGERAGLWLTGLKCTVDVIVSSVCVSSVLMVDFERAGGYKTVAHILENSSPERCMDAMSIAMRLFFDPRASTDDPLSFPGVGVIFSDVLISCIGLKRPVGNDDSMEKLIIINAYLQENNAKLLKNEHILQSFSYSLLTIYSNDPKNCNTLEEHFHYLPTLIAAIPGMKAPDTISAVLTTLNYVCQCVETAATLPLVSLCAAASTILNSLIGSLSTPLSESLVMQYDIILSSFDAILRSSGKYAQIMVHAGWLNSMICIPFAELCKRSDAGNISDEILLVYGKLCNLLVCVDRKGSYITSEIIKSGLLTSLMFLMSCPGIPPTFLPKLLSIYESLSLSQPNFLRLSLTTILDILVLLRSDAPSKSERLVDSLRSILLMSEQAIDVWISLKGNETVLNVLDNFSDSFNNDNNNDRYTPMYLGQIFNMLVSVANLFYTVIHISHPHYSEADFVDRIYYYKQFYRAYVSKLFETNIYSSNYYSNASLSLLFVLMCGESGMERLKNPSAAICLIIAYELLDDSLREQAICILKAIILKDCKSVPLLVTYGVVNFAIEEYFSKFSSPWDKKTGPILDLIVYCLSKFNRTEDLGLFLRFIVRPLFIQVTHQQDQIEYYEQLFPPWVSFLSKSQDIMFWNQLNMMIHLTTSSAPYISLGLIDIKENSSYLSCIVSDSMFPQPAFSFSSWIQLPNSNSESFSGMITLLSLTTTPNLANGCFLEVQLCCHNFELLVMFRMNHILSTLKFKPAALFVQEKWNLFTITYKRSKKFPTITKSTINVYINGLQSEPIDIEGVETEIPQINSSVEVCIGRSYIDTIESRSSKTFDETFWNLGPLNLFEDILQPNQIASMYLRGPNYTGTYQGLSMTETTATLSTYAMRECNNPLKSIESYFEAIDMKDLESVIDMSSDTVYESTPIPRPICSFSADRVLVSSSREAMFILNNDSHKLESSLSSIGEKLLYRKNFVSLNNKTSFESDTPRCKVVNNDVVVNLDSFAGSIMALGGPMILFPILQYASTEKNICEALRLLKASTTMNHSNMKYMKTVGYRVMAFLLSLKPSDILTTQVIDELFEFVVDRSYDDSKNSTVLIVDTAALFFLIVNHQIWDYQRYSCAMRVLHHFSCMIKDNRYGYSNACKLSKIGIGSWLIHMMVNGVDIFTNRTESSRKDTKISSEVGSYSGDGDSWKFLCSNDEDMSKNSDEKDPFLSTVMLLLVRIIGVEIRSRDLETISYIISLTFAPTTFTSSANTDIAESDAFARHASLNEPDWSKDSASPSYIASFRENVKDRFKSSQRAGRDHGNPMILDSNLTPLPYKIIFENKLPVFCILRVYLLRLLNTLYENHFFGSPVTVFRKQRQSLGVHAPNNQIFYKIFHLNWLLNCIEESIDIASRSHAVRLLGLFVQTDSNYFNEFCAKKASKVLESILFPSSSVMTDNQLLPLSLPLIALTFQIPIHVLPYPFQVMSSDKVLQLLELDECKGPNCSETDGLRFTLPMLSLLMAYVCLPRVDNEPSNSSISKYLVNDFTIRYILHYFEEDVGFRQLLQHRNGIELIASSLLNLSNAVDDYGSHIYLQSADRGHTDLISLVRDDYILSAQDEMTNTVLGVRVIEDESTSSSIHDRYLLVEGKTLLLTQEGKKLLKLLRLVIDTGFKEFSNTHVICHIMLSFPTNMDDGYTYSYQNTVLTQAKEVIEFMVQKNFGSKTMTIIANSLLLLIPVAKARVLHEYIQLQVFNIIIDLIERLEADRGINHNFEELFGPIIRELILTARYFASMLINTASSNLITSYLDGENFISLVLEQLRLNLVKLIPKPFDETLESFGSSSKFLVGKTSLPEDRVSGLSVLDSFQLIWCSESSVNQSRRFSNVDGFSMCISERLKISNACFFTLISSCFTLIIRHQNATSQLRTPRSNSFTSESSRSSSLDGSKLGSAPRRSSASQIFDSSIVLESLRILVLLSIHRRSAMKQLFSPDQQNSGGLLANRNKYVSEVAADDRDFYEEGISQLIPSKSMIPLYLNFLAGNGSDSLGEEDRFIPFYTWFRANNALFNKYFRSIDAFLRTLYPIVNENVIQKIQAARLKDRSSIVFTSEPDIIRNAENTSKNCVKIYLSLRVWKVRGIASISAGMIAWKRCYDILQSGLIWGYQPLTSTFKESQDDDQNGTNRGLLNYIHSYRGARLDPVAGPERMRRKLSQDYSIIQATFWENVVCETNTNVLEMTKESQSRRGADADVADVAVNDTPVVHVDETLQVSSDVKNQRRLSILRLSRAFRGNPTGSMILTRSKSTDDSTSLPEASSTSTIQETKDIEEFVKAMAQKGIIKRVDMSNTVLYDNVELSDENVRAEDRTASVGVIEEVAAYPIPSAITSSNHEDFDSTISFKDEVFLNSMTTEEAAIGVENLRDNERTDQTLNEAGIAAASSSDKERSKYSFEVTKSLILEELLKGVVGLADWTQGEIFNVQRICGLEASRGLLIMSKDYIHFVNGIALKWKKDINDNSSSARGKNAETSSKPTPLSVSSDRQFELLSDSSPSSGVLHDVKEWKAWLEGVWKELLDSDIGYNRTAFAETYSIFKRRHHLKYTALEYTDIHGYSILVSTQTVEECNQILARFFVPSNLPILFRTLGSVSNLKLLGGVNRAYTTMMVQHLNNLTKLWQNGEITNFEYLMQLNSIAGRSYLDLTQYPVFPWILRDYTSETIDLSNPSIYRDLSKPMGALGERRAGQFIERYRSMSEFQKDHGPPPFHYGTHYSCAGYVLHYLLRLQPYSTYAIDLQGGQFDLSDRLFLSIEHSWRSASNDNLQDVRELIPEFFYMPEFLMNLNQFEFGTTQSGQRVHDVELPNWANNDPYEFIRIHREALESKYVSEHLNDWIDLVFGYKQRGTPAEQAMNVFIHVTYEGEVDIDAITDPVLQLATIAQINNFGQTPSMLFNRPHPKKIVPEITRGTTDSIVVDPAAIAWHSHLSPPLMTVGTTKTISLNRLSYSQVLTPSGNPFGRDLAVRDVFYSSGRLVALPLGYQGVPANNYKKTLKYLLPGGGIALISLPVSNQRSDQDKEVMLVENIHNREITCVTVSKTGDLIVTGSRDTCVKLWSLVNRSTKDYSLDHIHTYLGHRGSIRSVEINTDFCMIVSCSSDNTMAVWDTRTGQLRFTITHHTSSVLGASINSTNGSIVSISSTHIHIASINGDTLCFESFADHSDEVAVMTPGSAVYAPATSEWQDGVVAVTGHDNGYVHVWRIATTVNVGTADSSRSVRNGTGTKSEKFHNDDSDDDAVSFHPGDNTIKRRAYIGSTVPKTHYARISYLKMVQGGIPSSRGARIKEFVDRTMDDSLTTELHIGDVDGFVSRWGVQRLDQLSSTDLNNIIAE